jgi:hypothetical protein
MKAKIYFLLFISLCCSCNLTRKDIPGTYISNFRVNNFDTLRVVSDGTYEKRVYKISDKSLLYRNKGNWQFRDGRIIFKDFFYESDDVFSKEFENYSNILITSSLDVHKRFGKIFFEFLEDENDYRYKKL